MIAAQARALGRLIEQLESGAGNDALGASLAAVVRHLRPRSMGLRLVDGQLDGIRPVDGQELVSELLTLTRALARHHVSIINFQVGTTPKEVLQLAALLAVHDSSDSQPSVFAAARRLGFWHVALYGDGCAGYESKLTLPDVTPTRTREDTDQKITEFSAAAAKALAASDAVQLATTLSQVMRTEIVTIDSLANNPIADASIGNDIHSRWRAHREQAMSADALRLVSGLLTTDDFPRNELVAIVRRAGDIGTMVMMQHLSAAASLFDRRLYYDAIVEADVGINVLMAHLDHQHWFVVRNAASLLGAMRATAAEAALITALQHPDDRVRTAVATALVQLATSAGMRALEAAIRDTSSEVRRRALRGLLTSDGLARSAAVVSEALDLERDPEVQLEVVSSLRQIATPQAVQQLVRLCSPAGSAGKSNEFKRAALEALVQLRPTAAAPFLRIQSQDRDMEVRAHAQALLERISRAA